MIFKHSSTAETRDVPDSDEKTTSCWVVGGDLRRVCDDGSVSLNHSIASALFLFRSCDAFTLLATPQGANMPVEGVELQYQPSIRCLCWRWPHKVESISVQCGAGESTACLID